MWRVACVGGAFGPLIEECCKLTATEDRNCGTATSCQAEIGLEATTCCWPPVADSRMEDDDDRVRMKTATGGTQAASLRSAAST